MKMGETLRHTMIEWRPVFCGKKATIAQRKQPPLLGEKKTLLS